MNVRPLLSMHPTVAKGLLSSFAPPAAKQRLFQLPNLGAALNAIASSAPAVQANLTNPTPATAQAAADAATQAAQGSGLEPGDILAITATLVATGEGAKWGVTPSLNPVTGPQRRKARPVKFLPASTVVSAAGAGTLQWAPQEPFEGFRFCIPSGQGAGFISNLTAGDRLMTTTSGRIPFNVLRENSDCGRIDLPLVSLGETISCQVSGAGNAAEIGGHIIGYGSRPRTLPDGAEILYTRWLPFDVTSDAAGATATITLQPQRNVILRRIVFDDSVANFTSLYVTSINVQDMPQEVANVEFPAQFFSELAQDDWCDFDMCQLGGTITIGLRNANAAAVTAQGMAVVDVVRLPNEARR